MNEDRYSEPSRAEITEAWTAGVQARLDGKPETANPHIARNPTLAKEWCAGWQEGSFKK
jgi:hypothetical protein